MASLFPFTINSIKEFNSSREQAMHAYVFRMGVGFFYAPFRETYVTFFKM